MSETQDSNLLHRGGFEALKQVQAESSYLFKKIYQRKHLSMN